MTVTYEQLEKANNSIRTTDIKGKDYAEVNQRIKAFRMVYPGGSITTEMMSNEGGVCVIKATCGYIDSAGNMVILGQGTAYEKEGSTFINKTSYIENCETSAVGRALGMAGFGIDTSVASAEEVQNAIANQDKKAPETAKVEPIKVGEAHVNTVKSWIKDNSLNLDKLLGLYKVKALEELTITQFNNIHDNLPKVIEATKEVKEPETAEEIKAEIAKIADKLRMLEMADRLTNQDRMAIRKLSGERGKLESKLKKMEETNE